MLGSRAGAAVLRNSMQEQSEGLSSVGRQGNYSKAQVVRWCEGTIRVEAEAEANNGDKAIDCPGPGGRRADCSALGERQLE